MLLRVLLSLALGMVACSTGAHSTARDAGNAHARRRDADAADGGKLTIVSFSKTAAFRHDSIAPATAALSQIATKHGAVFESTEDATELVQKLPNASVVVFLLTTGDVLEAAQETELERYVLQGGGFVGVHSAADTEHDWPFYRDLNGAWFATHPPTQPAKLLVEDNALVSFLPREWTRTDEWYNFKDNPRTRGVTVLMRLDESSYEGGTQGADHPIAWTHSVGEGRAFYTGLGHTEESWQEALFLQHVEAGLLWAAKR